MHQYQLIIRKNMLPNLKYNVIISLMQLPDSTSTEISRGHLYFEPGIHPIDAVSQEEVITKVQSGELDSLWNAGIGRRIASYKPDFIAIDSLSASDVDTYGNAEISGVAKAIIWAAMPGFPKELNGTDSITVVAGDNIYHEPTVNNLSNNLLNDTSLVGTMYAAIGVGATIDKMRGPVEKTNKAGKTTSSRRTFLSHVAAIATVSMLAGEMLLPRSYDEEAVRLDADLQHVPKLKLGEWINEKDVYDYINGRTALLITKMSELVTQGSVGCIVMGDAHFPEALPLLKDPIKRESAIRLHTSLMKQALRTDTSIFDNQSTYQDRCAELYTEQTSSTLITFTQPDLDSYRSNPLKEIDRTVTFKKQVVSPTISADIQGLLPKPK
jgi:hypothetical protein